MKIHLKIIYSLLVLLCAVGLVCVLAMWASASARPRAFGRFVLAPIPTSVEDIKMDRPWKYGKRTCVLSFRISTSDVDHIVREKSLKEFDWAAYHFGSLFYGYTGKGDPRENPYSGTNVASVPLYRSDQEWPKWFEPAVWADSKVYVLTEVLGKSDSIHTQALIHNESLNTAYFIDDVGDY